MPEPAETARGGAAAGAPSRERRRRRRVLRFLARWVAIYTIIVLLVYFFQRRLQYMPFGGPVDLPQGSNYGGLREVELRTQDDLRLRGWHWPGRRPVTAVVFPGNAGNRSYRLDWITDLHNRLGLGVLIVDYRGYGGSEGSPTEAGLYRDAEAVWSWLQTAGAGKVVYLGESLGTGVAVELARRHPPAALILQSGFPSAVEVAQRVYFFLPVNLLMKDRFENREKLREVSCPVLVIHGGADGTIPPRFGRALFEAAREPKEWYEVVGAGHDDVPWIGGQEYLKRLDDFIRRHAGE